MTILYQTNKIDWFDVLEHLLDGEAIKIYFHNSLETLTIWGTHDILLIRNSTDGATAIHELADMGVTLNGNLLQVLAETSLFENDLSGISLIETILK